MRSDRLARPSNATPAERAVKYLKRIAALTGAKHVCDGTYALKAGKKHFLVSRNIVSLVSRHDKFTCFSVVNYPGLPEAEVVASALVQLKNNPSLFRKWKKHPGYAYKADGKTWDYR